MGPEPEADEMHSPPLWNSLPPPIFEGRTCVHIGCYLKLPASRSGEARHDEQDVNLTAAPNDQTDCRQREQRIECRNAFAEFLERARERERRAKLTEPSECGRSSWWGTGRRHRLIGKQAVTANGNTGGSMVDLGGGVWN